jgi:hypothetical protein
MSSSPHDACSASDAQRAVEHRVLDRAVWILKAGRMNLDKPAGQAIPIRAV